MTNLLYAACVALAGIIALSIIRAAASPQRSIPGPFLARFTRLWYLLRVSRGGFERENIALHRRYGPVVRVAPGMFSVDLPEAVTSVYGANARMPKGSWYIAWGDPDLAKWSLFSDRDAKRHAETRRSVQGLYSMSSLVSYEGYVDECTRIFLRGMEDLAQGQTVADMTLQFQYFAFDVIGSITYSKRFGFLDKGDELAGVMKAIKSTVKYSTLTGVLPELHPWLYNLDTRVKVSGASGRNFLGEFVTERLVQMRRQRVSATSAGNGAGKAEDKAEMRSFLSKMLDQQEQEPDKITEYHLQMTGRSNIGAGADTTATTLAAILYHLLRNPTALDRLRQEVDGLESKLQLAAGHFVRFADAREMPYLQAVIKEAMRLHTAIGLPLWREVPAGGLDLGGYHFPEKSQVGLNPWCAHYNESVFGEDAAEFRPERWLEADEEKLRMMNAYHMPVSGTPFFYLLHQLLTLNLYFVLFSVWARFTHLYRKTHFHVGNVEAGTQPDQQV